ncbi:MAG: hypothetical protein P4L27_08240 [Ignavibacteriaceae bacterium]|nr:hypothetical protein [Ignavibacteriaceae bacterium]
MLKKLFLLLPLIFGGCATIHQTIYLQNVEVNGPINNPPVFISDGSTGIKISPWLSFHTNKQLTGQVNHSMVNSNGVFQVDTTYNNGSVAYRESNANNYKYNHDNIIWNLPNVKAGVDIDLPVSKAVSFFGSLNYSSQNFYQIMGGSFGIGFNSVTRGNAVRFNFGCSLQQYQYDASTVVIQTVDPVFGKEYTEVGFFHDIDKKSNLNFFGNLTYNTVSTDMSINFWFSFAFFSETLLDLTPETPNQAYYPFDFNVTTTDTRGETSTTFVSFSPGIYINVTPSLRLVVGINILKDIGNFSSDNGSFTSSLFVMPLAKIDFLF